MNVCVQMVAIFPYLDVYFCIATKWTRNMGFLITYSALLMKTWRVNLTYRVKSAHKLKLTDKQLLQWLFPILLLMIIYLCAWTISDPPEVRHSRYSRRWLISPFLVLLSGWDYSIYVVQKAKLINQWV